MSSINNPVGTIGNYSAVLIGDANGSEPLQYIQAVRTEGSELQDGTEKRWVEPLKAYRPAGSHQLDFDLTLYHASSDQIQKIAFGASLESTNTDRADKPGGRTQYMLVCLHPNETEKLSIFLPACEQIARYRLPAGKVIPQITLTFRFQDRNPNFFLHNKDTAAAVIAMIPEGRSPV